jgi:hypothetical protein
MVVFDRGFGRNLEDLGPLEKVLDDGITMHFVVGMGW